MSESEELRALRARCNKDNMYFLTRHPPVEITTAEGLFSYGNQCLFDRRDEVDRFGRCYLDKMFIMLCTLVHLHVSHTDDVVFKSLTCTKVADKYIARVKYDEEDLEMELLEMVAHFDQLNDDWLAGHGREEL